ncbi:MAG: type I-E CRISPR-associated protein Cse2/CasB [Nitrospirota bacterium]
MDTETSKKSRGQKFVHFVLERMDKDNAYGAALRRADNPATESQSWEYLARWCDIDKDWEWRPFATIAAAIAHAKPGTDGFLGIGKAIAACYPEDGNKSDSAKSKLRRLLACDSVKEACIVLRPLLSLIASRGAHLCYGQLLNELLYFGDGEKMKVKWAVDFYGRRRENDSLSA